jgi:hypothetical protein
MIWAEGGMRTAQGVGATDRRGETVIDRQVGPADFVATTYRHLGIDYKRVMIRDPIGRPIPIVSQGNAIAELTASS